MKKLKIEILNNDEFKVKDLIINSENIKTEVVEELIKTLIIEEYDDIEIIGKAEENTFSNIIVTSIYKSFQSVKRNN